MSYIKQFSIILIISFIGEVLNKFIPIPIPASIYGLVIMLICLTTGIIPLSRVKTTANYLIKIMPIMFIPAAVGLMEQWSTLKSLLIPVSIITLLTTIIVMVVSGIVSQIIINFQNKHNDTKEFTDEEFFD